MRHPKPQVGRGHIYGVVRSLHRCTGVSRKELLRVLGLPQLPYGEVATEGTHLRRDTVIPQWFQASKAAAASDGHAVHC